MTERSTNPGPDPGLSPDPDPADRRAFAVPTPLSSYRRLNPVELALIEEAKRVERDVLAPLCRRFIEADTTPQLDDPTFDAPNESVYVTYRDWHRAVDLLRDGMMLLIRSVARPHDPYERDGLQDFRDRHSWNEDGTPT